MAAIKAKFETDIVELTNPSHTAASSASTKSPTSVKALALAIDAKAIAMQAHQHIQEKKHYTVKNGGKVWLLNEITADKVKLAHTPFFGPQEDMEMEHKI